MEISDQNPITTALIFSGFGNLYSRITNEMKLTHFYLKFSIEKDQKKY